MQVRAQQEGDVLEVALDRPKQANALTLGMIAALDDAFARAAGDSSVRSVLVYGAGGHFCAGADVGWMRAAGAQTEKENRGEAAALAEMLRRVWELPKLVVVAAHGACYGGGAGLCCVADACVADGTARVRFSEVRLGLEPSTISPYVVRATGERTARRLFATAEELDAAAALQAGVFTGVVGEGAALAEARALCAAQSANSPEAVAAAKELAGLVARREISAELSQLTARRLAAIRASDGGKEGVDAFLEKRPPRWARGK